MLCPFGAMELLTLCWQDTKKWAYTALDKVVKSTRRSHDFPFQINERELRPHQVINELVLSDF